ncbi:vacuolar protein sorting-associated protein 37B [Biomphalaria pfeifferi]|uniref:Vacuolar protein sorting-associated protein 37B n=1 Tax=Biomphalaria pfeifferi TaxID=112525 RepID=A0AAD8BP26_BIOPF|nr:vacuolar protein sorting-associated protein 37B [Biomphalaria pfeifferi]
MYQNYVSAGYGGGVTNPYAQQPYYCPPSFGPDPPSSALSNINEQAATALLKHLDRHELEDLLQNDSKLQSLIDDLPQVKALQVEHDNLVVTTKSLAEYNLSLQPKLESLKQDVAERYQRANSLRTSLIEQKAVLDSLTDRQSLDTVLALLQTETAKTEEESEELADGFCEGRLPAEEFLAQYLPKRTQAHIRRIKSERFAELIRNGPSAVTTTSIPPANSWGATHAQPTNSAPYPTQVPRGPAPKPPYPIGPGYGMPQPSLYNR